MIHNIDPVFISLGPLSIRYYGLIYMAGFIFGYFFLKKAAKKKNIPQLDKKGLDDFIFLSVFFIVGGSRLFEVLFYEPSYYFSKKRGIPFFKLTDLLAMPAAFALFLGRIANFLNGELFGIPVENQINPPWYAVKFVRSDSAQLYRVPTQILESLKNLIIFITLFLIWKYVKNLRRTVLSWLFALMYAVFRFVIEFFKVDYTDQILGLSTGQLLCIPMFIAAFIGLFLAYKNNPPIID